MTESQLLVEPDTWLEMWGFDGIVQPDPGDYIVMAHADGHDEAGLYAIPMLRWFRFIAAPVNLYPDTVLPFDRPISVSARTMLRGSLEADRDAGVQTDQRLRVAVHARDEDGLPQRAVFIDPVPNE